MAAARDAGSRMSSTGNRSPRPLLQGQIIQLLVPMRLLTLATVFFGGGTRVASSSSSSGTSVVARSPAAFSFVLEGSDDTDDNNGLVVLPLLSHADVEERFRRERRQQRQRRGLVVEERQAKDSETIQVEKKKSPAKVDNGWIPSQSDVDPLYQGSGTHYVDLWVGCGDSPQRQTLIVDTGSSITAFPCANECIKIKQEQQQQETINQCDPYQRHFGTPYREDTSPCFRYVACQAHHECTTLPSPTATNVCSNNDTTTATTTETVGGQCRLSSAYLDGSTWAAVEAMDTVYTGGSHETPVAASSRENTFDLRFACQTSVTGLFQVFFEDGIMGMDRTKSSYWNQYFDHVNVKNDKQKNQQHQQKQQQRQFALCLHKNPNKDRTGSGAGAMILGGTDPRLHATPMAYAQLVNHDQYFVVWLEKIHLRLNGGTHLLADEYGHNDVRYQTVNALPIELNSANVIIDSGTTATFFSQSLAIPFQQAYRALTGTEFDTSERAMTLDELNAMPTILFQLSPAKIHQQQNNHKTASHYKHEEPGVVAGRLDPDHADAILVALPPHRYMRYIEKHQTYAPEIQFTENRGRNQILGAYFMDGKMIHFDVDNRRIGFAESTCNYAAPNPKFGDTTYPVFENHPPFMHEEEEEVEDRGAWFDSRDDPNSESSTKEGNANNNSLNKKNQRHKIRLVAVVILLILVVVSLLAACALRLIRRGRELRQLQKRQRQQDGESNTLPHDGRPRQDRNRNDKQERRRKANQKKQGRERQHEPVNRFDADDLERMAMLDFPTFGGEGTADDDNDDYNDDSGLMFDQFRDEPSVGDNAGDSKQAFSS
jgi:Eukaryotic aspartyl protease